MYYVARWYDPVLGRFAQADAVVPATREGGNENAIRDIGRENYLPLVVDYHENQFLTQLNDEMRSSLQDPDWKLPPVPTHPTAFDRYAYSFNHPIRYVDPSGHFIVAALALISPVGWVAIGVVAAAGVVYFAAGGPEAVATAATQVADATANGITALLSREYIPPGLDARERNAYREAVHRYKQVWGLAPNYNVDKDILDAIAELIKDGIKAGEAAESVDGPEEHD